jgi:branched-chain amino acid aminotransferase
MNILKMNVPAKFSFDAFKLNDEIIRLSVKNKCFLGTRVRLSVFRNDGGLYTPENNEVSYVIEAIALKNTKFELNQVGLKVDIFEQYKKPVSKLSNLKTSNSLLYILAADYRKNYFFDEMLLLNENNFLIESISSNLFICKDEIIYTPSLSEGCISGVMRKKIIEISRKNNFEVINDCMLTEENLLQADEIFLTNAVTGIKWVGAFKKRRYFNRISKTLINLLNEELF